MRTAIWKFLALSGVIALGCFVVYQVHTRIPVERPESVSPGDFTAVGPDADATDLGPPAAEAVAPGFPGGQSEPEIDPQPTLAEEAVLPLWDAVPVQSEPMSAADLAATVPETSGSDDPDASSTITQIARDPVPTVASDTPWLLTEQPESAASVDSSDALAAPGGTDSELESGGAAPRTLTPADQLRPLPGPLVVDNENWATDDPSEAASDVVPGVDGELIPVESVQQSPPGNPFVQSSSDPGSPDPERGDLPLIEFAAESDTAAADAAAVNPFSGFASESPASNPVVPADPQDAGFSEPAPLPVLPPVASNPFAFPPQDDESADESAAPLLPPERTSDPLPETPAFTGDPFDSVVTSDDTTEDVSPAEMQPLLNLGETRERPQTPFPTATDAESGAPTAEPESAANPLSTVAGDEEEAQPFGPFESLTPDPVPVPFAESTPQSTGPLDLVGDAVIDREIAAGPQQPELEIEKIAPTEATVGAPLIYAIHIKNVGSSTAHGVVVEDRIPRGTTLDGTIPQAELMDKVLTWKMGTIEPGQEETIRIRVIPTEAGEIGSVATVRFAAEVSAATYITAAELHLELEGPQEIAVGETGVFRCRLTNSGNGLARGAYIRCLLPPALEHPGGVDIEYEVGDLPPGGSSEVELPVRATDAGTHLSRISLHSGGQTHDESELSVTVLPSRLLISREGPARRFVGRRAEYTTIVTNRSGIELTGISVVEQLPEAVELAAIPADGTYDQRNRTITWTIPKLSAGASFTFDSTIVAREYGLHSSTIVARDGSGNEARVASDLQVAGFSSIEVDWDHEAGPVAVGEQVALKLTIRNQGTAPAENVQAVFEVPPQMEFVNAQGPVPFQQEGRLIRFENVNELAIDGEQSFDIVLTAAAPGSTRVSAQLRTADHAEPLRHDEAVFILEDEN